MDYDVENIFTYHSPGEWDRVKYETIRNEARRLALLILKACPDGPEKERALANLENAVMWANASIARNDDEDLEEKEVTPE